VRQVADNFIPKQVQSLNETRGRHWTVKHKIVKAWRTALAYFFPFQPRYKEQRSIIITGYWEREVNFLDHDNFVGGCKPVLDGLKRLGWIFDDSHRWLRVSYRQKVLGVDEIHETGTRVEVFIVEGGEFRNLPANYALCPTCLEVLQRLLKAGIDLPLSGVTGYDRRTNSGQCNHCEEQAVYGIELSFWELEHDRGETAPDPASQKTGPGKAERAQGEIPGGENAPAEASQNSSG